jgi:hypothetical protein
LRSAIVAAALVVFAAFDAHSQSVCDRGPFRERLEDRYVNPICLKENAATEKRVEAVDAAFKSKDETSATWRERAREQLRLLLSEVNKRPATLPYVDVLKQALDEAVAQLNLLPTMDDLAHRTTYPALQIDTWKPSSRASNRPGGLAAKHMNDTGCIDNTGTDPKCRDAFRRATEIGDDVFVAAEIISRLHEPQGKKFEQLAALREKRWHAYLYDTQFQYFWELGLNRWREETCFDRYLVRLFGRECKEQKRDEYDNPLGFREPPDHRAIFLHPDVGLQYIDAEPNGDRLKPALIIQWFGYQWWRWNDNEAQISKLRGISLVSTVSDNVSSDTLGWGVMIQVDQYAVAFTGHGSKFALTLNLQLGDKISKLNEEWADKLKRIGSR